MSEKAFPLLLTIRRAAKETGYPENFVRSLVMDGRVKSVKAGNRRYVNIDSLREFVNTSTANGKE